MSRFSGVLVLIALCACELQTTTPTPPVAGTIEEPPSEAGDGLSGDEAAEEATTWPGFSEGMNPLTGLPVADASILERRPVAVKITSYPRSNRPQWGLSRADIVYEYYHNNELTRFHAIFYGQNAEMAGPIRSARLPDGYLMDTYGGILTFASADARILERLRATHPSWQLVSLLEGECPPKPVCRYQPLTVNYLVADTAEVGKWAERTGGDDQRQALGGMTFDETRPQGGEDVAQIYLHYSYAAYSYWQYDSETGRYLRYQDATDAVGGREERYELLTDRLNGEAIATDNVVVLFVAHSHAVYVPPSNGLPAIEIVDMDFDGSGRAIAFRDGQAYELEWVKEDGKVLYLVNSEGEAYSFKPGTTWFQVVTEQSTVERMESDWHFNFVLETP